MEKRLYKGMPLTDFIQRLLTKRCVSFFGGDDDYLLLDAYTGFGPNYKYVGSKDEIMPLVLKTVLSYDEVKVTFFPNIKQASTALISVVRFQLYFQFPHSAISSTMAIGPIAASP